MDDDQKRSVKFKSDRKPIQTLTPIEIPKKKNIKRSSHLAYAISTNLNDEIIDLEVKESEPYSIIVKN